MSGTFEAAKEAAIYPLRYIVGQIKIRKYLAKVVAVTHMVLAIEPISHR